MSTKHSTGDTRLPNTSENTSLLRDLRSALRGVRRDYTKGSMGRAIVLLAVPMVLEMSMQAIFAVVDVFLSRSWARMR